MAYHTNFRVDAKGASALFKVLGNDESIAMLGEFRGSRDNQEIAPG
ncbi:MAG: hypothetical protein ACRERV_03735 [Methylococcales bacterium]